MSAAGLTTGHSPQVGSRSKAREEEWAAKVDAEFAEAAAGQLVTSKAGYFETQNAAAFKAADKSVYLEARSFKTIGERRAQDLEPTTHYEEKPYTQDEACTVYSDSLKRPDDSSTPHFPSTFKPNPSIRKFQSHYLLGMQLASTM